MHLLLPLSQPCHLVETSPYQVRFGRIFAHSSTQKCKYSGYAHLMRTGLDKMTRLGISDKPNAELFGLGISITLYFVFAPTFCQV